MATSLLSGVAEAAVLVLVSRAAFAIGANESVVTLFGTVQPDLSKVAILAAAVVVLRVGLAIAAAWQSARLSVRVVADIRTRLARAYLQANFTEQHGERAGQLQDLLTTFTYQASTLVDGVSRSIVLGSSLIAMLGIALVIDPISSIAVVATLIVLGLLLRPLRNAVSREATKVTRSAIEYAGSLGEISQLGMELNVFGVQAEAEDRVRVLVENHQANSGRLMYLQGTIPAAFTGVAYLALIGALSIAAAGDAAELSSIGAVMLVMLRSLGYGQGLQAAVTTVRSSTPFLRHLEAEFNRYDEARVIDHHEPIGRLGQLRLQDVSFEYTPDVPVLRHVSLTIEPCEVIGIVGPSGSGKSTLVQLLLTLREPTSGQILAEGRDIQRLSRGEWSRKVTFVPQEAHLFAGTVADNIRFLRADVTQSMIEDAAKLANLHDDLSGLSGGYQRPVGEQGSHLSGGQRQRLTIARALVEHPDLLILDEPTSSLDVRSEHLIRQTLDTLRTKMTIIIIAHRLSTLSICDRIMVIQDGELKAFDTPDNLEKSSDFYREALILSGLR